MEEEDRKRVREQGEGDGEAQMSKKKKVEEEEQGREEKGEKEKSKKKKKKRSPSNQEEGREYSSKHKKKKKKKEQQHRDQEESTQPSKKSKKKKHTKPQQQSQPPSSKGQQQSTPDTPKKKRPKLPQAPPQQIKQQQDQPQQGKAKRAKPSASKKKGEKVQSINVLNRQLAKQCPTRKSNFYLQKQEKLKQGLPVGRGSKRAQERIEEERKRLLSQKTKQKKTAKKETAQSTVKEEAGEEAKEGGKREGRRKDECTKEESTRIINLFAVDAGDYRGMVKQLPDIPLAKIRGHLRMLFQRSLEIITGRVQESRRHVGDWSQMERREIVRQLHRIRCTNRLLSEQNVEFRDKFIRLMMSHNDPSIALTDHDCNYLYRKIEAFVRGFCSLNTTKKKNELKLQPTPGDNRQPLLEGGYIMDRNRVKREAKVEEKLEETEAKKAEVDKAELEWTQEEERQLGELYVGHQANTEAIHEQLKIRFGLKNKWKDFELLSRKIDVLVKTGLGKLQELTLKPYCRQERLKEDQERKKLPLRDSDPTNKSEVSSLDLMTKFIYNNKRVLASKEDTSSQGGLFKNMPLLERQIFGHVESLNSRFALVKLLSEKFPPEEQVAEAIAVIRDFVAYAVDWERKNRILLLRQEPVLEEEAVSTLPPRESDSSSSSSEDKFAALVEQVELPRGEGQFELPSEDENIDQMIREALDE